MLHKHKKQFDCIREHTFLKKFNPNSIIVDLGAHRGKFSEAFAKKYPYKKIILVEANPYLIKILKNKFKRAQNIHIFKAAIGMKRKGKVAFYVRNKYSEGNTLYKEFGEIKAFESKKNKIITKTAPIIKKNIVKVKMITLNDIFDKFHLEKIDLLKVDIEGVEWDILENFSKQDYKRINQISVEFHDFLNPIHRKRTRRCINKLKKLGYKFINKRGKYGYGSPYFDCLFYKSVKTF